MTRVKRGNVARKRRKQVLKLATGFRGSSSKLFRTAQQQTMKALSYSYRDRQQKKREFCGLWITRLNAAARFYGLNYNEFRQMAIQCPNAKTEEIKFTLPCDAIARLRTVAPDHRRQPA